MMRTWWKLLAIVLIALMPTMVVADETAGRVTLSLDVYERLLKSAEKPREDAERAVLWTASSFRVDATKESVELIATLDALCTSDAPQVLRLPAIGTLHGFESLSGGCELGYDAQGRAHLLLLRVGRCRVELRSRPSTAIDGDVRAISWDVPDAPANRLEATLPNAETTTRELTPGVAAELTWSRVADDRTPQKLTATAREQRLYRIGEDKLQILSRLDVEVLRGELSVLEIQAPRDLRSVHAQADTTSVVSFDRVDDAPDRLRISVEPPATGDLILFWLLERPLTSTRGGLALPQIDIPDVVRSELVVSVTSPAPLLVDLERSTLSGFERVDDTELPSWLSSLGDARPLIAGRRTGASVPSLELRIARFDEVEELAGVVDVARLLTIITDDGRRIDRWRLQVQSRESVVRVRVPTDCDVWSASLDGEPVRLLRDDDDLLVKLTRDVSRERRDIEVIVAHAEAITWPERKGKLRLEQPPLPYPATAVEWSLLLPSDARYRHADGNVVGRRVATIDHAALHSNAPDAPPKGPPGTGSLRGTLTDTTGGILPGVQVTLSGVDGSKRTAFTDGSGQYTFPGIPSGRFEVMGNLAGFVPAVVQGINLYSGATLKVDLVLDVGGMTEEIQVSASAPLIDMRSSSTSVTIRNEDRSPSRRAGKRKASIEEYQPLPLSDDERNALQRSSTSGVATIPIVLPESGHRIQFVGYLLIDEAPWVEMEIRRKR